MKVICGLGNPGAEYHATRHNIGWWLLDQLQQEWRCEKFRRDGNAVAAEGRVQDQDVLLIKPLTYMNRSGAAVARLLLEPDFKPSEDLLVVVDDVALPVGKARMRARGSAGGHNGLKSVEAALRSQEYARLRIGVGASPPGVDLADWVLGPFERAEEETVHGLRPQLIDAAATWLHAGVDAASRRLTTGNQEP
ncbi:MAG TPA: aminoacyl-tRNA hydrolase [Longimicrobiales bacterium]